MAGKSPLRIFPKISPATRADAKTTAGGKPPCLDTQCVHRSWRQKCKCSPLKTKKYPVLSPLYSLYCIPMRYIKLVRTGDKPRWHCVSMIISTSQPTNHIPTWSPSRFRGPHLQTNSQIWRSLTLSQDMPIFIPVQQHIFQILSPLHSHIIQ
jgi:hypothetical protein